MNASMILKSAIVCFSLSTSALASTYGSVEPIATPDVIDTGLLKAQRLDVRAAFAERLLQCGIVDEVIAVLVSTRSITTINGLNTHIEVGAGGFFGETNPSYVFTIIDSGPNAASHADIKVLTDSLGYVLSQGSAFLLDVDQPASFDFPANYVVLNFDTPPPLQAVRRAVRDRRADRPESVQHRQQWLHAVRPRLPVTAVPLSRTRTSLPTTSQAAARVRRRVHADRRRSPRVVRGGRRVSGQRLGREPATARNTWPDPVDQPSGS